MAHRVLPIVSPIATFLYVYTGRCVPLQMCPVAKIARLCYLGVFVCDARTGARGSGNIAQHSRRGAGANCTPVFVRCLLETFQGLILDTTIDHCPTTNAYL